jgi:hypothetical protein
MQRCSEAMYVFFSIKNLYGHEILSLPSNVLSKRVSQASEYVKILHILHSTTHYTSNIEDIETKQIILLFIYPNSMFA